MNQMKADLVLGRHAGRRPHEDPVRHHRAPGQLKSISTSASFNGENWLSVNSSATGYNATKSIVASFSRDSTGAISIGTIGVDTSATKTFDAASNTAAYTTAVAPLATTLATDNLANNTAQALAKQTGAAADIAAAAATQATVNTDTTALATAQTGAGILDKTRVVNGTVLTGGIAKLDVSNLTDSAADQQTLSDYTTMVDHALTDLTNAASTLGSTQDPRQPPVELRFEPLGRDHPGHRLARRRRHEPGLDEAAGAPDPAAARHPVAEHREPEHAAHPALVRRLIPGTPNAPSPTAPTSGPRSARARPFCVRSTPWRKSRRPNGLKH